MTGTRSRGTGLTRTASPTMGKPLPTISGSLLLKLPRKPEGANMGHRFKFGPTFIFGNFLSSGASHAEAPVTATKRVNESKLENTPKRVRTENDAAHGIHSTPSSPELPEKSVAASSAQKKGAHDAPSLRSSADRSANGKGLEEYRSTEHRVGVGKNTRQRRKDKARRLSGGLADGSLELSVQKASPSVPYKSRNNLLSLQKPSSDPIQDDEEDIEVTSGPVARASKINGRSSAKRVTGSAAYTASKFTAPDESDDELSADHPAYAGSRPQRETGSVSQIANGRKRPSEIENDEELQISSSAKRRTQPTNRADMRRTTFGARSSRVGDVHGGLQVVKAVCEPSYVYPAKDHMHGDFRGASNQRCLLVSSTRENLPFDVVDAVTKKQIPDLLWLTPKASKVTQLSFARNSMTVKITRSSDTTTELKTGAVLFLQFRNAHHATQFVSQFCSFSGITATDNIEM